MKNALELRKQAEQLKQQAKDALKEAKRLERQEARKKAIEEQKKKDAEAIELYKVAEKEKITFIEDGKQVEITVLDYLRQKRDAK